MVSIVATTVYILPAISGKVLGTGERFYLLPSEEMKLREDRGTGGPSDGVESAIPVPL
jgi:hypothetical protein